VEAIFILCRQQRKMLHKNPGEYSHSRFDRHALLIINFNPLHSAARRIALKNKTTEIFRFQFPYTFLRPVCQYLSLVQLAPIGN
jgi:hypothetical protein